MIAKLEKELDPEPTATTAPAGMSGVTGTLLLVVLLLPSWPNTFSPQARMPPLLVRASTCRPPATAEVTVVPPRSTGAGWWWSVNVPSPSSPKTLEPQDSRRPVLVSARLNTPPPMSLVTFLTEDGMVILTGVSRSVVVTSPSCPNSLSPQASTRPVLVRARECSPPEATDVTVVPLGRCTCTGTVEPVRWPPSPSWPRLSMPQANSLPDAPSATPKASPALMAFTTVPPGRRTTVGVTSNGACEPVPSWPTLLEPQVQTRPEVSRAMLNEQPDRIEVTGTGMGTATGCVTGAGLCASTPSWPWSSAPQASTWPLAVSATT